MWLFFVSTILVALPLLTGALSRTHRFSSWRAARPLRGSTGRVRRARPVRARQLPSMCGLWTRSITDGGGLGGGTVATLVGASGGGFLGGARLAVTPLLGGPASGAYRLCSPRAPGPGCHRLEESLVQEPRKNTGSVAGEVGTISLEKIIFPIEGRPQVYKSDAIGFTEGV